MSNAAFKANYAKLLKKAGDDVNEVVRKTALELQTSMIQMSPVDTGRFKGNWQCGIGSINGAKSSAADLTPLGEHDPSKSLYAAQTVLTGWKAGQFIWLTNSMPYASVLEYGRANGKPGSIQAPNGMVRLTVQTFKDKVKIAADSIK